MSNSTDRPDDARLQERYLVRITGKGVTFRRRVPGWVAAAIVLFIGENRG